MKDIPRAVTWDNGELYLLDQRQLPHQEVTLHCRTVEDVYEAITTLTVRGAPAIGIAAAYGLLVGLRAQSGDELRDEFSRRCEYLVRARPTAVNLAWAVNRMRRCLDAHLQDSTCYETLVAEAISIHQEDARACNAIADVGFPIVSRHPNLLTHCNAGSLAVSELGTALAPIYRAHENGVSLHVYVDETRPLLQGARLTAYELNRSGIDCTLISDNMAAHVMSEGKVDMVIVGADRIAANGDAANKIGTLNLAILCEYFSLPFYVAVPLSTIDLDTASGADIVIEERDPDEVKVIAGTRIAPESVSARSPAFDVTPNKLISGIITDAGLLTPPYDTAIRAVMVGHK
ncbi:MAG: S-methyl-5-thioribose-1-phosphate isomerase [Gammaproteobacteria bacterium]|nr:S-methyl-5-thioribose-1-phosphate isomerase [Gammaproteobacteria bacterium]